MVTNLVRNRRGVGKTGCLLSVLLFVVLLYYGLEIGRHYWKLYEIQDAMKVAARFAQTTTDEQIRLQLMGRVEELGLPLEARRFVIRRGARRIDIRTQYPVDMELPFTRRRIIFRPHVDEPF